MTCCELHLRCRHRHCRRRRCRCCRRCCCCFWSSFSFSFSFLFLFVLSLPLSLSLLVVIVVIVVVVVVVVVFVVVGTIIVVSVVVAVVVIVVIAVAAWSCCCCRCYLCTGYFLQTPQNCQMDVFANPKKRQIGGVFAIFHLRGTKKHRKYQCFWLRTNAKPRYLRGFEPLRAKIMVFTVFCGPSLAKTLLFTQFPACWQKLFLDAKGTKTL